jgi:predicted glycosyltransferase
MMTAMVAIAPTKPARIFVILGFIFFEDSTFAGLTRSIFYIFCNILDLPKPIRKSKIRNLGKSGAK